MATARELFLVRFNIWLVSGGMITLNAWGKITRLSTCPVFNPMDMAASRWPLLTDWIPARTTSATKAAVYSTKPSSRAINSGLRVIPPLKLNPCSSGILNLNGAPKLSHVISGNPMRIPAETQKTGKIRPLSACRRRAQRLRK